MMQKFSCARCFDNLEHLKTQKAIYCENCGALLRMESWTDSDSSGWKSVILPEFSSRPSGEYEPYFKELRLLDEEWEKTEDYNRQTGSGPAFLFLGLIILLISGIVDIVVEASGLALLCGLGLAALIIMPHLIRASGDSELKRKRNEYGAKRLKLLEKLQPFRTDPESAGYISGQ